MQTNSLDRLDRAFANFARRHLYRDQRIAYLGDGTSTQTVVNPATSTIRGVWYYEKHGSQLMPKATATLVEGGGIFYENSTDNDNLEVWIGRRPFSNKTYVIRPTEEALSGWSGQTPLERKIAGIVAGGGAPTTASYITKVAEGSLSNEFALASLATGLLRNTTGTGVPIIALQADVDPYFLSPGPFGSTTPNTGKFNDLTVEKQAASTLATINTFAGVGVGNPKVAGQRARGSLASPAAVQNGDPLVQLIGRGRYDASNWGGDSAQVALYAVETFTATAQGAYIQLITTIAGTLTQVTALQLANDGGATFEQRNGTTNGVDNAIWNHNSTGTPANNFGLGHLLQGEDSTTDSQSMARWRTYWEDVTHATNAAIDVDSVFAGGVEYDTLLKRPTGVSAKGSLAINRAPAVNQVIQAGYGMIVPYNYEIPAGVTVEIGANGVLEIT